MLLTKGEGPHCANADYCPPMCTCEGTIVRCSNSGLTTVPRDIPLETTELYLDGNAITGLPPHIHRLSKLTRM